MAGQKKKITFEEALAGLEQSAEALKREDVTLEDAIRRYEEGLEFYKHCSELLSDAKQKIEIFDRQTEELKEF